MARHTLLLILALIPTACSNPDDQLDRVQQTTRSWSEALHLAGEEFQNSAVTQTYLHQTLHIADQQLTQADEQLNDIQRSDDRTRSCADKLFTLRRRIAQMHDALQLQRTDKFIELTASLPRDPAPATSPGGAP